MSEISEKAIKLIKDLRRDISIDIMFTPEKNAEDDSLKALVDYIAELEATVEIHADISNAYEKRISEIVSLSNKANAKLQSRIAELEALIEHASKTQPATEIKKLENVNTTGDFAEITFKDGRTIGFYLGKVGDGEWRLWDVTRRFCVDGER